MVVQEKQVAVNRQPLHVVAAAIVEDGRVLASRRLPGGHHGGLWEFPGGKVEQGETAKEALTRELEEELQLNISVGDAVTQVLWHYPHRSILLDVYLCEIVSGVPKAVDCEEFRWVLPQELKLLPMPEADRPVVEILEKLLAARGEG